MQRDDTEIYCAVLDALDFGVYTVDLDRRITFWNAGAERITGHSRAEVLGRACRENILVHCDENGTLQCNLACPLQQTLEDGKGRQAKLFLRHKQGHRVPVHIKTAALYGPDGHVMAGVEWFAEQWLTGDDKKDAEADADPHEQEHSGATRPREYMGSYLERNLEALARGGHPFGVLEVHVDPWDGLRKTHGKDAASSMMHVVEETLLYALGPADVLGRWNEETFLVVARDASVRALELDAELLRGMAASAQFRWWGDLLPVTVSVGGTLAQPGDTPQGLMVRAHGALEQGLARGGNSVTVVETDCKDNASSEV